MKNCIKGCGTVTDKKHCQAKGCTWWACPTCKIAFDPNNLNREIPWTDVNK